MDAKGNVPGCLARFFLLFFRHRQKLQVLFALQAAIHPLYYKHKHMFGKESG